MSGILFAKYKQKQHLMWKGILLGILLTLTSTKFHINPRSHTCLCWASYILCHIGTCTHTYAAHVIQKTHLCETKLPHKSTVSYLFMSSVIHTMSHRDVYAYLCCTCHTKDTLMWNKIATYTRMVSYLCYVEQTHYKSIVINQKYYVFNITSPRVPPLFGAPY